MNKHIVILLGSPNKKSRSAYLAKELIRYLSISNTHEYISFADIDAKALLTADFQHEDIKEFNIKIADADAIILASPVYKASITGGLKAFIDVLPEHALQGKIVLSLATGGTPAHLLATDNALHPIITSLKAERFISTTFATDLDIKKTDDGDYYIDSADLKIRLKQASDRLQKNLQNHFNPILKTIHSLSV